MTLDEFLAGLAQDGVARVAPPPTQPEDGEGLPERLRQMHERAALELAGPAPPLCLEAARHGARLLYDLAQGLLAGRAPADTAADSPGWTPPDPGPPACSPERAFSADLALRWLADLDRLARGLPALDPRRESLRAVARAHPLSAPGVDGSGPLELGELLEHPGLAQLYADRTVARTTIRPPGPS